MYLRRILMFSAAIVAINMQGCGCDDDKKYYPPPQSEQTFTVSGAAGKGVLRNFEVTAHPFIIGGFNPVPIAQTNTDNAGLYNLRINDIYRDQPLLYRVRPLASGSVMTCDLSDGCGEGVAFGDDLEVTDTSFTLEGVVPSSDHNQVINISMFTDLAAGLARKSLVEMNNGNSDAIRNAIARSNSQIANRFGILEDITRLPIIDLTNFNAVETALNAGRSEHIRYASINAAIAQAAFRDASDTDLISALSLFREYYVEGGIAGNTNTDGVTSFADILSSAESILQRVIALDPQHPFDLTALQDYLITQRALAENEEPDQRDPGTASENATKLPLEKVKAMVTDLRNLAVSFGDTSLNGGTIGNLSEDFAMQVEAAGIASSEKASHALHAMAIAAKAIDDANRVHRNNPQQTSYTSDDGVNVTITVEDEVTHFTVNQAIDVPIDNGIRTVTVQLTAANAMTYSEADDELSADGSYDVTGFATSAGLRVTIKEGSAITITNMASGETVNEDTSEVITETMEAFDLNLVVEMAQLETDEMTDPVTVTGTLSASLTNARIVSVKGDDGGNATLSAGLVSLKLAGTVSNTTGESANFALTVSGDGTGVSFVDTWSDEGGSRTGETEANYAKLYGSLAFTAKLTGIPNTVVLNFSVARTGYEDAENTLTIKYPGKQFRFEMLMADGAPEGNLTITNQDGVVMSLMETVVEGESRVQGNIFFDGEVYAVIEEDTMVRIVYADNSFESL